MKTRLLPVLALAVAGLAAFWFFVLRDPGGSTKAKPSTTPTAGSAGPGPRGPAGDRGPPRGDVGEPTVLIDDDPTGTLRLEGLVLDADEQPVAGATVVVSTNPRRTTTTESDGSFAFDKLVGRPYTLVARAAAGVGGPLTAKLTATSDPVVLRLRPAGSVAATVIDRAGQAVANAAVELRGLDTQTASTDASGKAAFSPVAPGRYEVVASASGFAPTAAIAAVGAAATEVTLTLLPGAAVSGRVVDEQGQPIAGARVIYAGASDWGVQADERRDGVVSGADGRWTFAALGAGSFRFQARHERFAPGTSAIVTLDGKTATDGVEIKLAVGATVAGMVVDTAGAPVASARVRIAVATRSMLGSEPRQVFTADDGTFTVRGLPKKPLEAVALAEVGSSRTTDVDASAGDVKGVVLTIDQTGTIAGVVVDKAGEPIEGVQVTAMPDFRSGTAGDPMQFRLRGFNPELTGSGGQFTLTGLAPGTYVVRASRDQGLRGRMPGFEGTKAETGTTNLRIVLPNDGGITGKVAFADGTVPTQFTVGIGFANEPVTSKDGSFTLDQVAPQKYQLSVRGPDFDTRSLEVTVEEGKVLDVGTITVKKGRAIAGRVTYQGKPVVGATIYAGRQIFGTGSTNSAAFGGPPGRGTTREATTDEEGRFRLTGLGPAALAVVAEHPDLGRSAARYVTRGAPDELQLEIGVVGWGVLTGTVNNDDGPADGTIVSAQSVATPNALYSVASGPDGSFRFDKLAPDVYKVSAMLGNPMRGMAFYSKQVAVGPDAPARVDLTVERGQITVKVVVTVAEGEPTGGLAWLISGAVRASNAEQLNQVTAQQPEGNSTFGFMMGTQPRTFESVRPGNYTACVALIPAGLGPREGGEYFQNHAADLPVYCKALVVRPAPAEQEIAIAAVVPPRLPDE